MSRRFTVAMAIAALAAATVAHAAENASDRVCTPDGVAHLVPARDELTALFARSDSEIANAGTSDVVPMGPPDVLMARVGADGKLVVVCVDNEAAARRFLEAPVESISRVKVK